MSTYIKFLEILSQAPNTEDTFKRMLKGKNLKKAGEQVKVVVQTQYAYE